MKILIILLAMALTAGGAFHTHRTRAQYIDASLLSEAFALIAPLKLRISDYYLQNGSMPNSNADAELGAPTSIFGTSVKRIAINRGGVLTVDFDDEIGKADMVFTPTASASNGFLSWRCTSDSLDPNVLDKLRPICNYLPATAESNLMKAIVNDNMPQFNRAIEKDADVNAVVNGNTPLMLAAKMGNTAVIKKLIEHGAVIDHLGVNSDRRTPLMVAITSNQAEAVAILLSESASVHRTDYREKSALDHAKDTDARLGGERYELMVSARLNPNFAGSKKKTGEFVKAPRGEKYFRQLYTKLRDAAGSCNRPRFRSLLSAENEFPEDGLVAGKPIDSYKSNPECATHLTAFVEERAVYAKALSASMSIALRRCDASEVRRLLKENPNVDVLSASNRNMAFFDQAAYAGCSDIVNAMIREKLLKGGLNDQLLHKVIQNAPEKSMLRLVSSLIEAGVDVNVRTPTGETALVAAIAADQPVVAKFLIDAGANANEQTLTGSYPVIEAAKKGYQHLVSQLLNSGADIDATDGLGRTATMAAVAQGKARLVESLLRAGANPFIHDKNGISASMLAESTGRRSILNLITATVSSDSD